jgi:tripartite ATP-independent transporter DctP family solute receptor
MKKAVSLVVALAFAAGMAFAGGGQQSGQSSGGAGGGAASGKVVHYKMGYGSPTTNPRHQTALQFKKMIEDGTNGQVIIDLYPAEMLGTETEMIQMMSMGNLDMGVISVGQVDSYEPKLMVFELPFLFPDYGAVDAALDSDFGQHILDSLPPKGLRFLSYWENGFRNITNSVRPITKPDDLKGVKMRVMESPVYISMFQLTGANPTPMSFNEVYTALQQGTVDGQENGAGLIYASKFQEVQKYLSLTAHVYSVNAVVINTDFYNSLPDDLKKVVVDGVNEGLVKGQREIEGSSDQKFIDLLRDAGMAVNDITPENRKLFQDAMKPLYDEYRPKIGQDMFDIVDKYNKENP